jgi:formylglycine-generating enzyme required for sulfatase activity
MRVATLSALLVCGSVLAAPAPAQPKDEKDLTNSLSMKLLRIDPGEFVMGAGNAPPRSREESDARDWDEAPAHKVRITKAYYLGATEVTNTQYEQFDPGHRKLRGKHGTSGKDDEPVVMVTWRQAVDFCDWLAKKEGKPVPEVKPTQK